MVASRVKALVDKGKEMREAQKSYFRKRLTCDLIRSKELEKEFDGLLELVEQDGYMIL